MRPLTFDEMDYVSGGGHGPLDDMIIVSAMQFAPLTPGGASLTSGTSGGVSGFASFGGIDLESLSAVGAAITQWLIELGLMSDPDEIVVTGVRPTPIELGPGTAIAFYPDGINQLFLNGQFAGNIRMTDGSLSTENNNNATAGLNPSISDTANFNSTVNYRFTQEQ